MYDYEMDPHIQKVVLMSITRVNGVPFVIMVGI